MRQFLSVLVLSTALILIALAGSLANAEGSFDSLEGRTQVSAAGVASYSTYSQFQWTASASAYRYMTPHFGLGGQMWLSTTGDSFPLYYSIGPSAEYFIPVGDRGHLFTQGTFAVSGRQNSTSTLALTAGLGYRYFLTEDIALNLKLEKSWSKENIAGSGLRSTEPLVLLFGFSLFF